MDKLNKLFMFILSIICIMCILFFTFIESNKIIITDVNPSTISKNNDFKTEDGKQTMSVYGKGFSRGDTIYLNGIPQVSTFGNSGWITCFISDEIYNANENIKVQIIRNGKHRFSSNIFEINVDK